MSVLSVADVLDRAADLLTPEGAWTQGAIRRDESGQYVSRRTGTAVCWCTVGATLEVAGSFTGSTNADRALVRYLKLGGVDDLERWNDAPERMQAEVIAAFRSAAALARSTPKDAAL